MCRECTAMFFNQFFANILIIVNFSIEYDDMSAILTVNRLRASLPVVADMAL